MGKTREFIVGIVCIIVSTTVSEQRHDINWKNSKPGELLNSLQSMISSNQPIEKIIPNSLEAKLHIQVLKDDNNKTNAIRPQRRIDGDSSMESVAYDYDKAYEHFVRNYFGDSVLSSTSKENDKDALQQSGMEESDEDPDVEETKAETCKNVVKKHSNCRICKNSRNGETSESCTYNKESTPKRFTFEIENKYHKHRDISPADETSSEKTSRSAGSDDVRLPICVQKTMSHNKNICYECKTSEGKTTVQCYRVQDGETKKTDIKQTQQRVYKRTVSYKNRPFSAKTAANDKNDENV